MLKFASIYTAITAALGILLGDALYANYTQENVMRACARNIAYDKSGDMICPQVNVKNDQ